MRFSDWRLIADRLLDSGEAVVLGDFSNRSACEAEGLDIMK